VSHVSSGADLVSLATIAEREARLRLAALVVGPIDHLATANVAGLRALASRDWPMILSGHRRWDPLWSPRIPLLLEAPAPEVSAVKELVRSEMCGAYALDPPLSVDLGVGDDWHEAKS
jgi:hypothetical protein